MMPSGTPNGGPNGPPSYLRTNSLLGQSGSVPTQPSSFPSLVSPRIQFGNNNTALLGNMSNPSSLLNNSFGNGSPGLNASHMNLQHGGGVGGGGGGVSPMDMVSSADPNPLLQQQFANPGANQMSTSDHRQSQQVEPAQNNYQRQFSIPHNQQHQQQQQQQQLRGSGGSVKTDPQMGSSDQIGPHQQLAMLRPQHQLSSLNNNSSSSMGPVKLEPQQLQSMRSLGSFKLESHQHSDPSLFLQQQQQQQLLQLSRQNSQGGGVHMNRLQQQRILQMQQQQQQQQHLLKSSPQQRIQLQQQQQQQQQQLQQGGQVKTSVYEPGTCARRLTHYMYHQQHRPADNNIEFWRKFVSEYFAPHAKKRWCVSLYGSGRQTSGVFPQDVWHCEICNRKPGRGFETTVEVLPRLCKIKYDSGTQEELLYVDMPREYQNASGQIVLDYAKAIQESVFDQLRVVRDGQLRIVFNSDLKICSWEFCARRHEELVPRRLIVPQVTQLVGVAQKYQAATQNPTSTSNLSSQDLHTTCNSFVASARQLAKTLEVPLVNDLGYTKRYVRCLQISEVVNSMIDLIDYSRETGTGPMASLVNFPRSSTSSSSGLHLQIPQQQPEKQKTMAQAANHNNDQSHHGSAHTSGLTNNGVSMNPTSTTTSPSTMSGHLLHQNSMISRQDNSSGHMNSNSYGGGGSGNVGNTVQIPSASSSSSPLSQPQPNNGPNPPSPSQNVDMSKMQQAAAAAATTQSTNEADMNDDPQSSVQQIIQEMMMSSQLNGVGSIGNDIKGVNGMTSYGNLGGGVGGTAGGGGIRAGMNNGRGGGGNGINQMGHDTTTMTTTMSHQQQQNLGNHRGLSNGLGRMNSFNNNLHFDWKTTQ